MVWAYLIVFSEALGSRKQVQKFLDDQSEVSYWYSCLPNCVFFTSSLGASDLAGRVRSHFHNDGRFLITEVHEDRQGWLPKAVWHLIRHPKDPRSDSEKD